MTRVATPAGPGPDLPDKDDESAHLLALVEAEPIAPTAAEFDDAFSALAALLLDAAKARRDQGEIPTPSDAPSRPDARRREPRPSPRPAGGAAA